MGGLGECMTCHTCFGFLGTFFLSFFILGTCCAITRRQILTTYASHNVFLRKSVPFGGPVLVTHHLGDHISQNPYFEAWRLFSSLMHKILKPAYCQNYCIDSNQIIAQYYRPPSADRGWSIYTPPTNPRWQTAAIFKKIKLPYLFHWFWWNLAQQHTLAHYRG